MLDAESLNRIVAKKLHKATQLAAEQLTPENLAQQVVADLDKDRRKIMFTLMGIDTKWSDWEMKNGDNMPAPMAQLFEDALQPIIRQWVAEHVPQMQAALIKNETKLRTTIHKAMNYTFHNALEHALRDEAEKIGKELAAKHIKQLRKELGL